MSTERQEWTLIGVMHKTTLGDYGPFWHVRGPEPVLDEEVSVIPVSVAEAREAAAAERMQARIVEALRADWSPEDPDSRYFEHPANFIRSLAPVPADDEGERDAG